MICLYSVVKENTLQNGFIPQIALYYLLCLPKDDEPDQPIPLSTQNLFDECLSKFVLDESKRDHLVHQALFSKDRVTTADAFAQRFDRALERLTPASERSAFDTVQRFKMLAGCPLLFATLSAYDTHGRFVRCMARMLRSEADAQEVKYMVWLSCGGFSRSVSPSFRHS